MKPTIYIITHKDFSPVVTSDQYKVIDTREFKDKVDLPLKDDFYSEFFTFKYIRDNVEIPPAIGFCHYRRYFSFLDNIPSLEEDNVIVTKQMVFNGTVRDQYRACHNIDDLNIIESIVSVHYPEYKLTMERFLDGNLFIPCNMFIMSGDKFKELVDFVMDIMDRYLKVVGYDIKKRIEENKDRYLKGFYPNNTPDYQYRIGGFLGERLVNIFILHHFPYIDNRYEMVVTENKYNEKG